MMLFSSQTPVIGCDEYMFEGQQTLQMVLVVVSLICIPVMLLGKPTYIMLSRKKAKVLVSVRKLWNNPSFTVL